MANRYANLPGSSKIKDTYGLINDGFQAVQDEMDARPIVNVTASPWGADPTGASDAGEQINAAMVWAASNGMQRVYIPAGTYMLEESFAPQSGLEIFGDGLNTILKAKPSEANDDFNLIETDGILYGAHVHHLTFDGNKENRTYTSFDFDDYGHGFVGTIDHCVLEYLTFYHIPNKGMWIGKSGELGYLNHLHKCHIRDAGQEGLWLEYRFTDSWVTYNNIGSTKANIRFDSGGPIRIIGNHLNGTPEYNIYFSQGCLDVIISQNIMEAAQKHGIYATEAVYATAIRQVAITNNIIRSASKDADDTYDLIRIEGRSDYKASGLIITGNLFTNHDEGNAPRYAVSLQHVDGASIVCNDMTTGYTTEAIYEDDGTSNVHESGNLT